MHDMAYASALLSFWMPAMLASEAAKSSVACSPDFRKIMFAASVRDLIAFSSSPDRLQIAPMFVKHLTTLRCGHPFVLDRISAASAMRGRASLFLLSFISSVAVTPRTAPMLKSASPSTLRGMRIASSYCSRELSYLPAARYACPNRKE